MSDTEKKSTKKRKENRPHRDLTGIILGIVLLVGLSLLAYPTFADYWNSFHQARSIMDYTETISSLSTEEYDQILESARQYNKNILERGILWNMTDEEKDAYNKELSYGGSGSMGFIEIPKIGIRLPVYHGTSEDVLKTSIGHIEGSSLPVGGEGSHCVLSGHRGLPSAKLFSDLDQMREGDTFILTILNETLTYEVDQIRIVLPTDVSTIQLEPGKDYCTLVTCTPYGVNTHRLLVRGHRIANADGDAHVIAEAIRIEPIYIAPVLALPILLLLLLLVFIMTSPRIGHAHTYVERKYLEQYKLDKPYSNRIKEWEEAQRANHEKNGKK